MGVILGPGGLRWIPSLDEIRFLAEFGVVFLMFTLGLEFSIPKLRANKKVLLGVGGLQVFLTTIFGTAIALAFEFSPKQAFIISSALALSSTAVVVKQLIDQNEHFTPHGNLSINILLFQDLAAILFLILIPAISTPVENNLYTEFLLSILKDTGVLFAMIIIGLWFLRPLFHEIAKAHSTELFMLTTLLVALTAAGISYYFGLSMALGAFLAGLVLGETEFRHQIALDIRPFKDVLLGLFFIVLGTYLELNLLPENWHTILFILGIIILVKIIIITLTSALFGNISHIVALRTGLILAHGGEFSFIVLTEAINHHIISSAERPALFGALICSIILSPLMIKFNALAKRLTVKKALISPKNLHTFQLAEHAAEFNNHVILCGFGRVGQILARFLEQENIPWIALDLDPMRISKTSTAREHSFYGDAMHPDILAAAGLSRARMLVITFSNETTALNVVKHVRNFRLDIPVFVRTRNDTYLNEFRVAGATEVVPESLEGSIMLASHLLLTLGIPTKKILAKIRQVHTDRYEILQGLYNGADDFFILDDDATPHQKSLYSIAIPENIPTKTFTELFPENATYHLKSISRGGKRVTFFSEDFSFEPGDVLVVFATPEEYYLLEEAVYF